MVLEKGKDQGKPLKFRSWEERCEACKVSRCGEYPHPPGVWCDDCRGWQDPCVSIPVWRREHEGKECPRVPLSPENGEAVTLTMMLIGEQARGLAPMYFDAISEGDGAEDRLRFLERVLSTLGSPLVVEAQRISMDRASKKAAASKGRK